MTEHFVKLPVEFSKDWNRLRYADRALASDMVKLFGNERHIEDMTLDELGDHVCSRLAIPTRERPTVRRALERMAEAGVLVVDGEGVRLLYSPADARAWKRRSLVGDSSVTGQSVVSDSPVTGRSVVSEPKLKKPNRSGLASRSEKIDQIRERRESAHESGVFELVPSEASPAKAGRPRAPRKTDPRKELFQRVLREQAVANGTVAPALNPTQRAQVLERAESFAALRNLSLEDALARVLGDSYRMVAARYSSRFDYAVLRDWREDWSDQGRRRGIAEASRPESFAGMMTIDEYEAQAAAE